MKIEQNRLLLVPNSVTLRNKMVKSDRMDAILRAIRTDLRLSMNGAVAASMRQMGVNYRMNFGVDIARIKEISAKYEPGKELAEVLWNEEARELKILATMLCPPDEMTREAAHRWAGAITNQELREQACKNLFQVVPFADELVEQWSVHPGEAVRATGYWLLARLCITRAEALDRMESREVLQHAVEDLKSDSLLLYQSALNALRFFGRTSGERAAWVMREVSPFNLSGNSREREMYEQLRYEFDLVD